MKPETSQPAHWNRRKTLRAFILLFWLVFVVGCTGRSETVTETHRQTRTVTKTITQQATPGGAIIELTTITTSTTNENTGETQAGTTEVLPPKIVGSVAGLLGNLATGGAGATIKEGVEKGMDWLNLLLAGGGGVATATGVGHVVLGGRAKRRLEEAQDEAETAARQRDDLIRGIERAKKHLSLDAWKTLIAELEKEQDRDTKDMVAAITGKRSQA